MDEPAKWRSRTKIQRDGAIVTVMMDFVEVYEAMTAYDELLLGFEEKGLKLKVDREEDVDESHSCGGIDDFDG